MKKRIMALILCLAMLTATLCVNAFAATPAKLGGTYTVKDGVLTLTLTISSNPGINTLVFDLDYNKDALSVKSITNGNVFSEERGGSMFEVNTANCPLRFYFDENNIDNITANGTLATVVFDVKANADFGFKLTASSEDTYASNKEEVMPVDVDITVTEIKEFVGKPGDINGDSKVNASDALMMKKLIVGKLNQADYKAVADLNGDNKINASDAKTLKRLIVTGK